LDRILGKFKPGRGGGEENWRTSWVLVGWASESQIGKIVKDVWKIAWLFSDWPKVDGVASFLEQQKMREHTKDGGTEFINKSN